MTNRLLLIIGPSGSGKTSLAESLSEEGIPEIVSHTTRPRRSGEFTGIHYFFVSSVEFDAMVAEGAMIEHVTYNGHRYGSSRQSVLEALERGPACVVVESSGARQFKAALGDLTIALFLEPPPIEELRRRMLGRADAVSDVEARLATVEEESARGRAIADFSLSPRSREETLSLALSIVLELNRH